MGEARATYLILGITALCTWWAFSRPEIFQRLIFRPDRILRDREYHRLFSSALIHADWMHFAFNAIAFASFGETIEAVYGTITLVALYLGSILGGSVLALLIHRHDDYSAVGASGGVCGLVFAAVFLLPGMEMGMLFVPIPIPGWLFAIVFLLVTFFGIKSQRGNIGHDAHLGGALVGLAMATVWYPRIVLSSLPLLGAVALLTLGFLIWLVRDPRAPGRLGALPRREAPRSSVRYQRYDEAAEHAAAKQRLDELLDKVSRVGIDGLSADERRELNDLAAKHRR